MFRVCVDTGGTFTDPVVLDEKGSLTEFKTPTTYPDFSTGFLNGLSEAAAFYGRTPQQFVREIETIVHGTTVATNAILTRSFAKTALITTKGFRDILEIRRALKVATISMYNWRIPPYKPIVPRYLRFVVEEETRHSGEVIKPVNEEELRSVIRKIKGEKVEAVAICFINSYANPENERRVAEICRQELNGIYVTASHEVLPIMGEYERESTCVLSACLGPIVSGYLTNLEKRLRELGFKGQLLIMQADQLAQSVPVAIRKPVYLMNSGPAAGPAGGVYLGEVISRPNLITADMGGTSFDITLVKDREVGTTVEKWREEERMAIKMVDVTTIGAGGGSIAWFDSLGLLRVGPGSAGAEPGPACYGRGGEEPTVTDADVILGYIPGDYFLGGKIKLEVDLAKLAVSKIADRLKLPIEQAAHAILVTVNSFMADAITQVSTKQGHDVRDFSLLVFGGAGPVHGAFLAELLGIPEVIVPKFASSFCAWGMFTLDIGRDYVRSYIMPAQVANPDVINQLYQGMKAEALADFAPLKIPEEEVTITKSIEMRYMAQYHDIEVTGFPASDITSEDIAQGLRRFHQRHEELYSFSLPFIPVELRNLRLAAKAKGVKFPVKKIATGTKDASGALKRKRLCFFDGGYVETPIYDGARLKSANVIKGPAVIEEITTTVVIPRGFGCSVDKYGSYILRR